MFTVKTRSPDSLARTGTLSLAHGTVSTPAFVAGAIMLVATHPRFMLVAVAYGYLASGLLGLAVSRFRHRGGRGAVASEQPATPDHLDSAAG